MTSHTAALIIKGVLNALLIIYDDIQEASSVTRRHDYDSLNASAGPCYI